ncbi:MAG TPA: sugar ABC transporter permease [Thermoanaerobaculia bacterium]|jgi:D-xylose transport system permease protein|nr:sugar ABC transporter permease [Thermoanaerobaculia bacterium]
MLKRLHLDWRALTMVGALLAIWVVFSVATEGTFLLPRNLSLLARQMAVTSILAVGMVLVIVAGQIDLSVGALAGLTGALAALAYARLGWPLAFAILLALAVGAALGALEGSLVAWLRIPPFIVTLGGMLVFQGALLGVTGGVSTSPPRPFLFLGQAYLPPLAGWIVAGVVAAALAFTASRLQGRKRLGRLGLAALAIGAVALMNAYAGVPVPVLVVLALATVLSTVARHTPFGRHLYAIGGNREAAFYSGIAIEGHLVGVFTLMGLLAGAAGVVLTARVGAATPNAGQLMELDAIAAAVIGGTSLLGGQGTVWGALLGALVMASLDNGMSLLNTEAFWQPILKGGILVAAVAVDMAGRRGRG